MLSLIKFIINVAFAAFLKTIKRPLHNRSRFYQNGAAIKRAIAYSVPSFAWISSLPSAQPARSGSRAVDFLLRHKRPSSG
jgi:hypothetical protein